MVVQAVSNLDQLLQGISRRLQLSQSQHKRAVDHYNAVAKLLLTVGSPVAQYGPTIYPQGSLRIGTTVKPYKGNEFDLDLVCELNVDYRSIRIAPSELVRKIGLWLRSIGTYAAIVEIKNRCIRINYKDDFHLDIVIACKDRTLPPEAIVIPDREAKAWKATNPVGFAMWFQSRAELSSPIEYMAEHIEPAPSYTLDKYPLQRVVQLIKRHRDVAFFNTVGIEPVSIVLTTLAGEQYSGEASLYDAIRTTLTGVIARLPRAGRLIVCNPAIELEDLSERWNDPEAYSAFVEWLKKFSREWADLQNQIGLNKVAEKLRVLFGETVVNTEIDELHARTNVHRKSGSIFLNPTKGALTVAPAVGILPVMRNTFHGD